MLPSLSQHVTPYDTDVSEPSFGTIFCPRQKSLTVLLIPSQIVSYSVRFLDRDKKHRIIPQYVARVVIQQISESIKGTPPMAG